MSKRPRKPSANSSAVSTKANRSRRASSRLDRPFDPDLYRRAQAIAGTYRLTFERDPDVGFVGASVEMPYVMADGPTIETCASETMEALSLAVATMLERGERPPSAASAGRRELQVNIRLTPDERSRIEEAARREGFRSVSDYIRTSALKQSA